MRYVSIDIETLGLKPDKHDIVEFGAVLDDLTKPLPYDKLPRFHAYVLPWRGKEQPHHSHTNAVYHGEAYAMSMHPTILRRIAKLEAPYDYLTPELLVEHFRSWLWKNNAQNKITFCGKNFASFDLQFLKRIPNWDLIEGTRYRTLDPTPFYIKIGKDEIPPSTSQCLARAGFPTEVAHTAIEDAINVIRLVRHGFLVHEPTDWSDVPEQQKLAAPHRPIVVKPVDGKLTPVFAETVKKTRITGNPIGFTVDGEKK